MLKKLFSKSSQDSQQLILEGNVGSTLLRLAIPMMFGIVSIVLFNIVDTLYVGHLGSRELAALSFTFPVVFFVINITIGLSIGVSAVLAKAIGEGNQEKVRRVTTHGLLLGLLVAGGLVVIGLWTMDPLFRSLGAEEDVLPIIKRYMTVWYSGIGLLVIPMLANGAIRATGDTRTPSLLMVIVGVVNVILDPFFIFGIGPFPRWEVMGAAVVTVIAWGVSLVVALWVLIKREKMISFEWPSLRSLFQSWGEILHIGFPAAITNLMAPLAMGIFTRFLSDFGEDAVAAYGVATRIESMAIIGMLALSSVLTPFIGQNLGAKNPDRLVQAARYSLKFCLVWSGALFLILLVLARPLGWAFTDDEKIVDWIQYYLWAVSLTLGGYGISISVNAIFNALHRPLRATSLMAFRLFLFAVPLAYLGGRLWEVHGIFLGIALGNLLIGFVSYGWVHRYFRGVG